MKTLTLLALAVCAALSVPAALAQGKTTDHGSKTHRGMVDPMKGLTPAEKKTFMDHMAKMSPAEQAVHLKYVKGLMAGKPEASIMTSMSPAEKKTLQGMIKKTTPAEMKVMMKMKANMTKKM